MLLVILKALLSHQLLFALRRPSARSRTARRAAPLAPGAQAPVLRRPVHVLGRHCYSYSNASAPRTGLWIARQDQESPNQRIPCTRHARSQPHRATKSSNCSRLGRFPSLATQNRDVCWPCLTCEAVDTLWGCVSRTSTAL